MHTLSAVLTTASPATSRSTHSLDTFTTPYPTTRAPAHSLAMFLSLLLGRACEPHQLTLGVGLGSCLVTCFCLSVSRSRPLVRLLRGAGLDRNSVATRIARLI